VEVKKFVKNIKGPPFVKILEIFFFIFMVDSLLNLRVDFIFKNRFFISLLVRVISRSPYAGIEVLTYKNSAVEKLNFVCYVSNFTPGGAILSI